MADYEVYADEAENRIYLRLEGMLDEEMVSDAVEQLDESLDHVEPGFDIINDISEFKPMSQDAAEEIEHGKAIAAERGARAAIRVTGESVIGKMQFERAGQGEEAYHVATAETVEDAEELLEEFEGE